MKKLKRPWWQIIFPGVYEDSLTGLLLEMAPWIVPWMIFAGIAAWIAEPYLRHQ